MARVTGRVALQWERTASFDDETSLRVTFVSFEVGALISDRARRLGPFSLENSQIGANRNAPRRNRTGKWWLP